MMRFNLFQSILYFILHLISPQCLLEDSFMRMKHFHDHKICQILLFHNFHELYLDFILVKQIQNLI